MMSMVHSHSLSQKHGLRQEQCLSHSQILAQRMEMRLKLLQTFHGVPAGRVYRPAATCPRCGTSLTLEEILKGFNNDPNDLTTKCVNPECDQRFAPRLVTRDVVGSVDVGFYCPAQALHALRQHQHDTPEDIAKNVGLWESLKLHFGGLKAAFKAIGINYRPHKHPDWEKKISSFLGRVPDTLIASVVEVSPSTIRRLRNKHGFYAYNRW